MGKSVNRVSAIVVFPISSEFTIYNPTLPLAVYRELAAHLRQIAGIDTIFLAPETETFSYGDSQIAGLRICCPPNLSELSKCRLQDILTYYGDRYGGMRNE